MAVALRLYRLGKKHHPSYRIVAVNKRDKRNGAYIESIGFYDPMTDPATFKLEEKKFNYWVKQGAIVSSGLRKLLRYARQFKKG